MIGRLRGEPTNTACEAAGGLQPRATGPQTSLVFTCEEFVPVSCVSSAQEESPNTPEPFAAVNHSHAVLRNYINHNRHGSNVWRRNTETKFILSKTARCPPNALRLRWCFSMVARKFDGLMYDTPSTFFRDIRRALSDFGRFHPVNEEVTQVSDLVPTVVYSSGVSTIRNDEVYVFVQPSRFRTTFAVRCEGTY